MENSNTFLAVIVIVAVGIAVAAGTAVGLSGNGGGSSDDGGEYVYTLYVGMQDSETHVEYDRDVAAAKIDAIVLEYSGGLTRYEGMGAYTYEDGTLAHESSLVYVLAGLSLEDVHAICDEVKAELNQESVMIAYEKMGVEFY